VSKPTLKVIEGGKVDTVEIPEQVEFTCPSCGLSCIMFPRSKPLAVQHAKPTCKLWNRGETQRFLIKAGVHLHVPGSETSN